MIDRIVQCTVYDCNICYISPLPFVQSPFLLRSIEVPSYNVDCSLFIAIIFIVLDFDNLKCHNF